MFVKVLSKHKKKMKVPNHTELCLSQNINYNYDL